MDKPYDHGHAAQRLDERRAEGAEWRRQVPLSAQAQWKVPPDRTDPVEILVWQVKTADPRNCFRSAKRGCSVTAEVMSAGLAEFNKEIESASVQARARMRATGRT